MTRIEHELLIVHLEGENWICDAGQGSATPLEPVLLTEQLLEREQTENKGKMLLLERTCKAYLRVEAGLC